MTRCKFKCVSVGKREGWNGNAFHYSAEFLAVTGKSEENEKFFASTPSGEIKVSTVRDDVFEVGREYYVNFTPAS